MIILTNVVRLLPSFCGKKSFGKNLFKGFFAKKSNHAMEFRRRNQLPNEVSFENQNGPICNSFHYDICPHVKKCARDCNLGKETSYALHFCICELKCFLQKC